MADPVHSAGTDNSFSGAIVALLRALGTGLGPKPLVNPGGVLTAQEAAANGPMPPTAVPPPVHNYQPPGGLGNSSPGLGNSF
jgi:hypothetical protein